LFEQFEKNERCSNLGPFVILCWEEKRADISQYFPIFLWVLRDFHLTLQDEEGGAITEKEYLERALRLVPGQEEMKKCSSST
jgi:hypothetical protein